MSLKNNDIKEISSHEHQILGSDFCSGYTDIFGKWNTGFDCPRIGNGKTVYCCGTVTYKYCCTKREQHTPVSGINQSVLLGSALGAVAVVAIVTLVSCLICRRFVPPYHSRATHSSLNGGPVYTMHCSSTSSGMHTYSCPTTVTTTPMDPAHYLMDIDNPDHHIYAQPMSGYRDIGGSMVRTNGCLTPSDPPPPYENPRSEASANNLTEQSSSSSSQHPLSNQRLDDEETNQNPKYSQTKF